MDNVDIGTRYLQTHMLIFFYTLSYSSVCHQGHLNLGGLHLYPADRKSVLISLATDVNNLNLGAGCKQAVSWEVCQLHWDTDQIFAALYTNLAANQAYFKR